MPPMCLDMKTSSENSPVVEHAVKIRKPYTITKQRERWTDKEHNKFLEALKLYGRAWRQIEDHIGTKTAVQIRSHAQKFFSKVVRESASSSSTTVKAVDIPPPRPKRKPAHPYPRKLENSSSKAVPILDQLELPLRPTVSVSEQENRSPTSVLSGAASDIFGSSVSKNCCTSVASFSVSLSEPVETWFNEQESRSVNAATSAEENNSASPDKSTMEVDLDVEDCIPLKEAFSSETQATSLKLFGRTVIVADSKKPSSSCVSGSAVQYHKPLVFSEPILAEELKQNMASRDLSADEGRSEWNLLPGGMPPMLYCLSSHGNLSSCGEARIYPAPWLWAFYGGVPMPPISPESMGSGQHPLPFPSYREGLDNGNIRKEGSLSASNSNTFPTDDVGSRNGNSKIIDRLRAERSAHQGGAAASVSRMRRSQTSAFRSLKVTSDKSSRGFVPYRSCVAAKAAEHARLGSHNGDDQGVRLCL